MADPESGTETWRVLLFARNGAELLVLRRPLGLCLPALCIPRHHRIAENLNAEAHRTWNIKTVCLAPVIIPNLSQPSQEIRYHSMEVRQAEELSRIAPRAMDISTAKAEAFSDKRDYLAIRRVMRLDADDTCSGPGGPFADFGTFQEITDWVQVQLAPLGRKWDGEFRQLHASESFALIRFQTNDGSVWFKATGEPNQNELSITQHLSALFPKYLPEILAEHDDWNAWLTEEILGPTLDRSRDPSDWHKAARSLADLQIASIGHTSSLLGAGARDSRTRCLLSKVKPFFAEIEKLMEAQIKAGPKKLAAREIRCLALQITEALHQMQAEAIPDALNHFDLNPGNIVVRADECKFLDWAEAAVGHPFFSFEYLRQHFSRTFGDQPDAAAALQRSYAQVWRQLLPAPAIEDALDLLPLVAPFAFAATTLCWSDAHRNGNPEFAGFLRSLARRMHRAAEQRTRAA